MAEKEKSSRGLFGLFKKDKSSTATSEAPTQTVDERRRLVSSLSAAEKAKRRSTIGPSSNITASFGTVSSTTAAPGSSSSSSAGLAVPAPAPVKAEVVDTQFSKMFGRSSASSGARDTITPNILSKTGSSDAISAGTVKSVSRKDLSKEEKKQRRKSLLGAIAPFSLVSASAHDSKGPYSTPSLSPHLPTSSSLSSIGESSESSFDSAPSPSKLSKEALKAKRSTNIGTIFGKDQALEELSFSKLSVQSSGSSIDKQVMKQKQKQLQKQMERDARKQEKQDKVKQERAHEILQAQLELGRERATMPEPQPRFVAMPPQRPARLTTTIS